jgi:hypothetical protein
MSVQHTFTENTDAPYIDCNQPIINSEYIEVTYKGQQCFLYNPKKEPYYTIATDSYSQCLNVLIGTWYGLLFHLLLSLYLVYEAIKKFTKQVKNESNNI